MTKRKKKIRHERQDWKDKTGKSEIEHKVMNRRISGYVLLQRGYIRTKVRLFCGFCNELSEMTSLRSSSHPKKIVVKCAVCGKDFGEQHVKQFYQQLQQMVRPEDTKKEERKKREDVWEE